MNKQQEIPMFGGMQKCHTVDVDDHDLMRCHKLADAIQTCWMRRRDRTMDMREAAKRLGVSYSKFSKVISGSAGMLDDFQERFEHLCGNNAISQYHAMKVGRRLVAETWAVHLKSKAA